MPIHRNQQPWQLSEADVTPHHAYLNRRQWLKGAAAGAIAAALPKAAFAKLQLPQPTEAVTAADEVFNYVNFYEFGSHKQVAPIAQQMPLRPWQVVVDGLVEKPTSFDIDDLLQSMPIEERITQHRCVEAWAFVAPWRGFSLQHLLKKVVPMAEARYVRFTTLADEGSMPGLEQFWYPWPYEEGLTLAEAMHELTFMATGLYGEDLKPQNGAPVRLVLPWKYGFKSIKSIVKISLTQDRPVSFWEKIQPKEYGFWANVHPEVSHPRWSQASHRMLGTDKRVATLPYNGYAEWVSDLYPAAQITERTYFF